MRRSPHKKDLIPHYGRMRGYCEPKEEEFSVHFSRFAPLAGRGLR